MMLNRLLHSITLSPALRGKIPCGMFAVSSLADFDAKTQRIIDGGTIQPTDEDYIEP